MKADAVTSQETPGPIEQPTPSRRRKAAALTTVGVLSIAAVAVAILQNSDNVACAPSLTASDEARLALRGFLQSQTPEERSAHAIDGQRLLPVMQSYYTGREVEPGFEEQFAPVSWRFEGDSHSGLTALELLRDRGRSPVVACFRNEGSQGWLMDWEIWTQTMDDRFREFILKPAEGQATLRVRLTSRGTSPEETRIEVRDPFSAEHTITFDIDRPDLKALYSTGLPAGKTRTATVELVWLNDSLSGTLKPILRRHICWGFAGLDGVDVPEFVPPSTRKYRPPPVEPAALAARPAIDAVVRASVLGSPGGLPAPKAGSPVTAGQETAGK